MDLEQILKIPVNIPLSVLKCPSWPDITNISTQLSSKTIISLIFPMRLNAYSSLKLPILSCLMILAQIYLSFSLFLECTHLTTTPPLTRESVGFSPQTMFLFNGHCFSSIRPKSMEAGSKILPPFSLSKNCRSQEARTAVLS